MCHLILATSYPGGIWALLLAMGGMLAGAVGLLSALIALLLLLFKRALPTACRLSRVGKFVSIAAFISIVASMACVLLDPYSGYNAKELKDLLREDLLVILGSLPVPLIAVAVATACRRADAKSAAYSPGSEPPNHPA